MTSDGVPQTWEERWHPLREEWVILAAHRQHRPWTGETVGQAPARPPRHDPSCHLCPGNARVSGLRNADYEGTFVFDNDHPCVGPDAPEAVAPPPPYQARRAAGVARVVCFSPRHDLTLAEMPAPAICEVVEVWRRETRDLGARPEVEHVLCFENKGVVVGVSNPHPHVFGLNDGEASSLAAALKDVTVRFDNLWQTSFPYVMALHQAPAKAGVDAYHFYIAFHPPLRRPSLLKYLAGPEIGGGNFVADTSPEEKAMELRTLPALHHASSSRS